MTDTLDAAGKTDNDKLVSVVIPTRNRRDLLREAIEAIFKQTMDPAAFEIIVVDNLSTDDTSAMIRQLQANAPCDLRYHVMEVNRGPAPARNKGVELARGGIIAFTDSDCRPEPAWLERGTGAFTDDVALVTGSVVFKPEQPRLFFSRVTAEVREEHPSYPTANAFYLRDVFLEMGGFDASLCFKDLFGRAVECADSDLAWRIKKNGYRNVFIRDAVVHHELELQTPGQWLMEPLRLCALPALVRQHPELRRELLFARMFYYPGNLYCYVGALGLVVAAVVHWAFVLLIVPFLIWKVAARHRNPPRALWRLPIFVGQAFLHMIRQVIMCATLIYGSLRFRTLVL